jgi:hypothetical protein
MRRLECAWDRLGEPIAGSADASSSRDDGASGDLLEDRTNARPDWA